jgi:hypothetical protein
MEAYFALCVALLAYSSILFSPRYFTKDNSGTYFLKMKGRWKEGNGSMIDTK